MLKRALLLFIVTALSLFSSSCSREIEIPRTNQIISTLCDTEINLPAGRIYSSDFDKTDKNYLQDRLLASYFGEPNIEKYKNDWASYSFFLSSSAHPCEFVAIYCSTPEALIDTSRMLASRLDTKKKLFCDKFKEYTDEGAVITIKNYAVLIISSDTETAVKAIKKICK